MSKNRIEVLVTGDSKELQASLREAKRAAKDMADEIASSSGVASVALGGLAVAGGSLLGGFVSAAAEMQKFQAQLTAITGSSETAKAQLEQMAAFAAKTPFELPGVVEAGIKLKALGVDSEKFLPIAGNLAAAMGRDIPDAALALGKALSGSQDGIQVLADSYGISRAEMVKFGAEMKSTGAIDSQGAALGKLQGALEKIIQTRYGSTMAEQSKTLGGAISNLSDSVGQLKASFGQDLAPTVQSAAKTLTGIIDAIRGIDPGLKGIAVTGTLAVTAFAGIVGAGMALQVMVSAAAAKMVALNASIGQSAIVATAAAQAMFAEASSAQTMALATEAAAVANLNLAKSAMATATTEAQQAIASQAVAAAEAELVIATEAATAANAAYIGSADGLIAAQGAQGIATAGLSTKLVAMATTGLGPLIIALGVAGVALAGMTAYMQSSTAEQEKSIASSIRYTKAMHDQKGATLAAADAVRVHGANTTAAAQATEAALRSAGKTDLDVTTAIAANLKMLTEAEKSGNKERVDAINGRLAALRAARANMAGMHDAEVAETERATAADKKRTEAADNLLKSFQERQKAGAIETKSGELAELDAVMKAIGSTHKEFGALKMERIKLAREAAKEIAGEEEKARKERVDDEIKATQLIVGNDQNAIQQRIAILQRLLASAKLSKDERHSVAVDLAREEAALEQAKVKVVEEAERAKTKAAQDRAKVAADLRKAEMDAINAEKGTADTSIDILKDRLAAGEDVLEQLRTEMAERAKLEESIIKKKGEGDKEGKSAEVRAKIEKATNEQIKAERMKAAHEIEKMEADLAKKKKDAVLKDIRDTINDQLQAKKDAEKAEKKATSDAKAAAKTGEPAKKDGFTLGGVSGVEGMGDFSVWDVKKQPADPVPILQDIAKQPADPVPILQDIATTLKTISQTPVTIKSTMAGADPKTSTNKLGGR